MVKEGIVLGHKISKSGIEVDRAKIDVIAKLPYPTNVKGHFNILKNKLTTAPEWNLDFELMCDAIDYAVGAVLEFTIKIKDKKGTENLAADHLSRLKNLDLETLNEEAIRDSFLDEYLTTVYVKETAEDLWTVNGNRKEWVDKLDDTLLEFRNAYKSPIGSTPFRIVYGNACHLPMEMEPKAYWALKT
ncbi:reverse transcriptase domain-containing protein [Tanacetum coccineum]